jgi:hypothetical protein
MTGNKKQRKDKKRPKVLGSARKPTQTTDEALPGPAATTR